MSCFSNLNLIRNPYYWMSTMGSAAYFQWAAMKNWTVTVKCAQRALFAPLVEHSVMYHCRLNWFIYALLLCENVAVFTCQSISTPTRWWHHRLMRKTAMSIAKWERCHYLTGVVQMDCCLPQPHPISSGQSSTSAMMLVKEKKKQTWRKGDLMGARVLFAVIFSICYPPLKTSFTNVCAF